MRKFSRCLPQQTDMDKDSTTYDRPNIKGDLMASNIKTRCKELSKLLNEYSDCGSCGQVIKDPDLLVPDSLNPGQFRSTCPLCKKETWRYIFPSNALKPVFDMLIQNAEINQPILVLVLSCTVYEALVEGLFIRLLERHFTYPDITDAVIGATDHRSKMRIIQSITGKKPMHLVKSAGYEKLTGSLDEIKKKRNAFLHTGVVTKDEIKGIVVGKHRFPYVIKKELDEEDIMLALDFTINTIDCFAQLYSDYGEYIQIDEPDY